MNSSVKPIYCVYFITGEQEYKKKELARIYESKQEALEFIHEKNEYLKAENLHYQSTKKADMYWQGKLTFIDGVSYYIKTTGGKFDIEEVDLICDKQRVDIIEHQAKEIEKLKREVSSSYDRNTELNFSRWGIF